MPLLRELYVTAFALSSVSTLVAPPELTEYPCDAGDSAENSSTTGFSIEALPFRLSILVFRLREAFVTTFGALLGATIRPPFLRGRSESIEAGVGADSVFDTATGVDVDPNADTVLGGLPPPPPPIVFARWLVICDLILL
jgi:hypothetical protein